MIRALIIDDEAPAREVMYELLTSYIPNIEVVGQCSNVPDAVLEISKLKPDVIFLDIEMPKYSGFELLSFFNSVDFEIIFVTAYSQYALRAFEVSAVDYVLKPVQIEHLQRAIEKLKERVDASSMQKRLDALKANLEDKEVKRLVIPMSDGLKFIKIKDISHIEAHRSYSQIFMADGNKLMTSKPLAHYEETVEENEHFLRTHRSYIINLAQVISFNKGGFKVTMENGMTLNISRDRKNILEEKLLSLSH